jgi:chaperone modulatory protein CbpM
MADEVCSFAGISGGITMRTSEFLMQARLDAQALDFWIDEGWLRPHANLSGREFSDIDLARARLICDLRSELGINDEAVPVVLDLLDQIYSLRRLVCELMERNPRKEL